MCAFLPTFIFLLQVEKLDQNEWWTKINQMKNSGQQELIIKRNFGREGEEILGDMARQLGLYL